MKKILQKTFVIVLALALLAGCVAIFASCGKKDGDNEVTVTDLAGREISVTPNKISRVVCVGAGALRLYSYVGDMEKIYAVEEIEGSRTSGRVSLRAYQIAYEEQFKKLIADGKTAGAGGPMAQKLNVEVLADLEPDLVFSCLSLTADELSAGEKAIGCPIVTLKYGAEKAFSKEIESSLKVIDTLCGKDNKADKLIDYMHELKADIQAKAAGKTSKSVYLACNSNWGVKGFLSTSKNYPLFTVSNITNVMDDAKNTVTDGYADLEAVVTSDAERIILDAGGLETFKGEYNEQGSLLPTALDGMQAFRNKEVYLMMPNNAYDANVETYFINAYYALSVAYDLEIDMQAKANEITKKFLGKELYNDITIYGGYQKLNLPDVWPTK